MQESLEFERRGRSRWVFNMQVGADLMISKSNNISEFEGCAVDSLDSLGRLKSWLNNLIKICQGRRLNVNSLKRTETPASLSITMLSKFQVSLRAKPCWLNLECSG
jgi:hypothetical protein